MKNIIRLLSIYLVLFSISESALAEAYCALRDPVETINRLYPSSTSYKSIVKVINEDVRRTVGQTLPPNSLHFSELGKHTLYVVMQSDQPLGYVHVRSEQSEWGLVEIAWAINLDLTARDFRFQRCRSRYKNIVEHSDFRTQLIGRNYRQLADLFIQDSLRLDTAKIAIDDSARALAEVVVRSGMKTLLVTELGWRAEVKQNSFLYNAKKYFEHVSRIEILQSPIDDLVIEKLNTVFSAGHPGTGWSGVDAAKVVGFDGATIGVLYRNTLALDNGIETLQWTIAADGTIVNIDNLDGWSSPLTRAAFQNNLGQVLNSVDQCSDRAALFTLEASTVVSVLLEARAK